MALYAFNGTWNAEKTDDKPTPSDETAVNTNGVWFSEAPAGAVRRCQAAGPGGGASSCRSGVGAGERALRRVQGVRI
jgi:hypothetical protein